MTKLSLLFLIVCFVHTLAVEDLNEDKTFIKENGFTEQPLDLVNSNSEVEEFQTTDSDAEEIQITGSESEDFQTTNSEVEEIQTINRREDIQATDSEVEEFQTTDSDTEEIQTTGSEIEEFQTTTSEREEVQSTKSKEILTTEINDISSTEIYKKETTESEISTGIPSAPCNPNPCQNGGVCKVNQNERFECKCLKGTRGKLCERVDGCKVLRDDGTTGKAYCDKGEAMCVSKRNGNFSCVCYNRRKEFNYEIGKCKAKDMCSPNPCQNGGICSTSGYQAHCECPEGAYGRYCNRVNWCFIKMDNGKSGADYCDQGEAKCVENRKMKNFTCVCYNKRKTFDEELHECIDESEENEIKAVEVALNECQPDKTGYDECRDRYAICFEDPYSYLGYICVCEDGTKLDGETCKTEEDLGPCSKNSEGYNNCQEVSAECVVNPEQLGGYQCQCANGMKLDENFHCTE